MTAANSEHLQGTVTITTPVTVTAASAVHVVITGVTNPAAGVAHIERVDLY